MEEKHHYPENTLKAVIDSISQRRRTAKSLELLIRLDDSDMNVRDMAGYLEFIDRVYGRLVSDGLRSYAQKPDEQIQVAEFRPGSLEMIFQELLTNMDKVSATIILGLILKYLPDVLDSLASAYKNIEEAQLIRLQREQLRKKLEQDEIGKDVDAKELQELAAYIESIYRAEQRHLPAAGRFADKYVKTIRMRVLGKN